MASHAVAVIAACLGALGLVGDATMARAADPLEEAFVPRVTLGGRLHSRYRLSDTQEPDNTFALRRARLSASFKPLPWLEGELDLDAAKAPAVKDGLVTLTYAPWLKLSSGQFKKPFSLIETTSSAKLPLVDRGIVNDRFIDGYGFGGRDLGAMLSGDVGAFAYAAGVFNGASTLEDIDPAKDLALRFTAKPVSGLRLGLSAAAKLRNVPNVDYAKRQLFALGLDVKLKLGWLELNSEALWGEEGSTRRGPGSLGVVTYIVLHLPKLTDVVTLRPLVAGEFLDDSVRRPDDYAMSAVAGLNIHLAKLVRVMVQARLTRSTAVSATPEERLLLVQLALDSKVTLTPSAVGANEGEGSQL